MTTFSACRPEPQGIRRLGRVTRTSCAKEGARARWPPTFLTQVFEWYTGRILMRLLFCRQTGASSPLGPPRASPPSPEGISNSRAALADPQPQGTWSAERAAGRRKAKWLGGLPFHDDCQKELPKCFGGSDSRARPSRALGDSKWRGEPASRCLDLWSWSDSRCLSWRTIFAGGSISRIRERRAPIHRP